jgi:hypothetical protein
MQPIMEMLEADKITRIADDELTRQRDDLLARTTEEIKKAHSILSMVNEFLCFLFFLLFFLFFLVNLVLDPELVKAQTPTCAR